MGRTFTTMLTVLATPTAVALQLPQAPRSATFEDQKVQQQAAQFKDVKAAGPHQSRRVLLQSAGVYLALTSPAFATVDDDGVYRPARASLSGRRVLITGANTGLGLETAIRLTSAGASVIGTARTSEKARGLEDAVRSLVPDAQIRGVVLDLASLDSIKSFTKRAQLDGGLDVVVNNAGVMALPEELYTEDGFERQIGINFLGHFALTALLLPFLRKRPSFRVINVSSAANYGATSDAVETSLATKLTPPYSQWGNYCLSKLFNIMFSVELQRRFDAANLAASSVSLHPGAVATDLGRYLIGGSDATSIASAIGDSPLALFAAKALSIFVLPVDKGANTQVYLAANADTGVGLDFARNGGLYFDSMRPSEPNKLAFDPILARRLWSLAAELTNTSYEKYL